eukprot:Skav234169  [mRNA]  locus=scaffold572:280731:286066:+ [translate_table: standard]
MTFAVASNLRPNCSLVRQGDLAISRRKDSSGVMPSERPAPFDMPSVCVGSTPLCNIMAITALGSSPMGGIRKSELCELAIQAVATCKALAPS